ncbi:permease [Methanocrinis sp.]|uniref:permease n=1 Tax=Methanocrinis sp. TaxID=3101522 RepID=UPI003D13A370
MTAQAPSGKHFLALLTIFYLGLAAVDFDLFLRALSVFAKLLSSVLPVLALVLVIMSLLNLAIRPGMAKRMLGKGSGLKGWTFALVGGVISSGPIYVWYPLIADLREKGMRDSLVAAFLYSRAVKIPMIPLMVYYFGWNFTLLLTFYLIIFSVLNGLVVERLAGGEDGSEP